MQLYNSKEKYKLFPELALLMDLMGNMLEACFSF